MLLPQHRRAEHGEAADFFAASSPGSAGFVGNYFSGSGTCSACHDGLQDSRGKDISISYGEVAPQRQAEIIRTLAEPQEASAADVEAFAEAVVRRLQRDRLTT
jgi:cytochrome c553